MILVPESHGFNTYQHLTMGLSSAAGYTPSDSNCNTRLRVIKFKEEFDLEGKKKCIRFGVC